MSCPTPSSSTTILKPSPGLLNSPNRKASRRRRPIRCEPPAFSSRAWRPTSCFPTYSCPDGQGIELVADLESREATEFVLLTGHASVESAIDALRAGATDYLVKPVDVDRLRSILRRVPRPEELREEIGELRQELRELGRYRPDSR